MKNEDEPPTKEAAKAGRGWGLHWSTIVAAVATLAMVVVTAWAGRAWRAADGTAAALEAELSDSTARNVVLEKAAAILKNEKFEVCNKTADTLTISWVSVAYHDGHQLRRFDSSLCHGWRPQVLNPGDSKALTFSSSEEGCNWSGAVMLYAFNFVRESDEYVRTYNVAGQWTGFDRCYLVE
jgi:hypothetical protein